MGDGRTNMRLLSSFFAGAAFAGLALVVCAPVLGGWALVSWLSRGDLWTTLSGQSYFAGRDVNGEFAGRTVNVEFHPLSLRAADSPRRLLIRTEVSTADFASGSAEGRVRFDAWALTGTADLRKPPLYTVVAPGRAAILDPEGMLVVTRIGGRRSYYSLAGGHWIFDSDAPLATLADDGSAIRFAALAAADDGMSSGAVAVLTYASAQRPIRRLVLIADDPIRARFVRGALAMTRPVFGGDGNGARSIEIRLSAGLVHVPLREDDLDVAGADVPAGFQLAEIKPWLGSKDDSAPVVVSAVKPSPATTPEPPERSKRGHGH